MPDDEDWPSRAGEDPIGKEINNAALEEVLHQIAVDDTDLEFAVNGPVFAVPLDMAMASRTQACDVLSLAR